MRKWLQLAGFIDRANERMGRSCSWLALVMVLLGAYNAVARYLGRSFGLSLSSNSFIEAQWYLFSLLFLLGSAYALLRDEHVRVDVLYARLSQRGQAWTNLLGTTLLLLPFTVTMTWISWPSVRNSFLVREISPDPGGLVRYPLKAVILVFFISLSLQGVSMVIRNIAILRNENQAEDTE